MIKEKETKDGKYNKGRKPLFRVEINASDSSEDAKEMIQMKADIIEKSGTAKRGVIDMYKFSKECGYFNK